ncbi:MAG: hypothetical protein PWP47_1827 [Synergistaceae bacterium]|nr:hypothetical protein [Synergistaceae bacterium]
MSTFDKDASGPQNLVEVLEGRLEKGLLMVDSGVIHQDGHGAEPLFHRPGKLFRTPGVRHVTGKVPGPVSQLFSSGSQQIYPAPGKNSHVSHLEPASVVRNLPPQTTGNPPGCSAAPPRCRWNPIRPAVPSGAGTARARPVPPGPAGSSTP